MYAPIQYGIPGIIFILIDQSATSKYSFHDDCRVIDEETLFANHLLKHISSFYNNRTVVCVISYGNPTAKVLLLGRANNSSSLMIENDSDSSISFESDFIKTECGIYKPDMTSAYLLAKQILSDFLFGEYSKYNKEKQVPSFAIPQIINITTGINYERLDTLEYIVGEMNAISSNIVFSPECEEIILPPPNYYNDDNPGDSLYIHYGLYCNRLPKTILATSSVCVYRNVLGGNALGKQMIFINPQREKWEFIISDIFPQEFPGCCALYVSDDKKHEIITVDDTFTTLFS